MTRVLFGAGALAVLTAAVVFVLTAGSGSTAAQDRAVFVVAGEDGAPACSADPCEGITCLLQGEPAPSCECP